MKYILPLALMLIACDQSKSSYESPSYDPIYVIPTTHNCAEPKGRYRYSYQELSGNCEEIQTYQVSVDGFGNSGSSHFTDPLTGKVCDARLFVAPDNCTVVTTANCTIKSLSSNYDMKMTIASDGKSGSGTRTETWFKSDGSQLCKSTYKLTFTYLYR